MKKWVAFLAVGTILGACASSDGIVYLTNDANQRVKCGPFSADAPVALFLEERFGAPNAEARIGASAETKLRNCIEDYQQQGFAPEGPAGRPAAAPPPAVAANPAQPVYQAAIAAEQGDSASVLQTMRRRAEQGDTNAQTVLGKAYEDGLGVPQDYVQAHMWYNLAAANSATSGPNRELRDIAFQAREAIARLMSREQIAEAQKMAREWKPPLSE